MRNRFPRGFRVDDLSLWLIRRYGWCELGFNRAFIEAAVKAAAGQPSAMIGREAT